MKNIKDFILENKKQWEVEQYIKKEDFLKLCIKALDKSNTYASDILDDFNWCSDHNIDLDDAYDNNQIDNYMKFVDALADIISDDNKYGGSEGDICDHILDNAYDIMRELYKMTSK